MKSALFPFGCDEQMRHTGWHAVVFAVALALVQGCTAIPQEEFQAYKDAWSKANAAAEQVYTDFSLIIDRYPAANPKPVAASLAEFKALQVNIDAVARADTSEDFLSTRLKALELVSEYNGILADLAAGKRADGLASAIGKLVGDMQQLPIKQFSESMATALSSAASRAVPYLDAITPLIEEMEREFVRREFVAAVATGGKIIQEKLIPALLEDAKDIYDVRFAVFLDDYDRQIDRPARAQRDAFLALTAGYAALRNTQPGRSVSAGAAGEAAAAEHLKLLRRMNAALRSIRQYRDEDLVSERAPWINQQPDAMADSQLLQFVQEMEKLAGRKRRLTDEAEAYGKVITNYVRLLLLLRDDLSALQAASVNQKLVLPPVGKIVSDGIALKKAVAEYHSVR